KAGITDATTTAGNRNRESALSGSTSQNKGEIRNGTSATKPAGHQLRRAMSAAMPRQAIGSQTSAYAVPNPCAASAGNSRRLVTWKTELFMACRENAPGARTRPITLSDEG